MPLILIMDSKFEINRVEGVNHLLGIMLILLGLQGCVEPVQRLGQTFEGSVKWALQIAQPEITNFASDAQIYSILGAMIWKDGRLPSNTGDWSFVTWSPSLKKKFQVTIDFKGNITKRTEDFENPPNTGSRTHLPVGWVNSPDIFSSIPSQVITKAYAQLVVFNFTEYSQAPNTDVWAINFAGGKNPLVKWDGHYIGTQFN
jgi:hypothetical protein